MDGESLVGLRPLPHRQPTNEGLVLLAQRRLRHSRLSSQTVVSLLVEKVVKKLNLKDGKEAPLYEREESMRIFFELLKRGRSFYPDHGTTERYPRICRVAPLRES